MSDLANPFETKAEKTLFQILSGAQNISVITKRDVLLLRSRTDLIELNQTLNPSLRERANTMRSLIFPSDLALFLLAAKKRDLLKQAEDIINTAENDRRVMSLSDLMSALEDSQEISGAWAASMYGELGQERHDKPKIAPARKSSINLAAMHRGMGL